MKTPEEIKETIRVCQNSPVCVRDKCVYYETMGCGDAIQKDALAYIEQLEETIALMLIQMRGDCGVCKHNAYSDACLNCLLLPDKPMWEYEGLPQLPGKDERHEKPV